MTDEKREKFIQELKEETGWSEAKAREFANSPVIQPQLAVKAARLAELIEIINHYTPPSAVVVLNLTMPGPWWEDFQAELEAGFGPVRSQAAEEAKERNEVN